MSDEFDQNPENYSAFWPLLVLVVGLLIWYGYQDYSLNKQRSYYKDQVEGAQSTIQAAEGWHGRYNSMVKDLNDTSTKGDTNAVPILQAAVQAGIQAGLLRVQPGTNATATPAAPASN
ncbi:MAG TPA: hypothetical protein VGZ93_05210 [Candidatus Methylacidiphilales bacterium]|jgi:hypothetical protein|nr:hypothetical protein [Candidatus Methylacidiphilales bacterium]